MGRKTSLRAAPCDQVWGRKTDNFTSRVSVFSFFSIDNIGKHLHVWRCYSFQKTRKNTFILKKKRKTREGRRKNRKRLMDVIRLPSVALGSFRSRVFLFSLEKKTKMESYGN